MNNELKIIGKIVQITLIREISEHFKYRYFTIEFTTTINGNNYVTWGVFRLVQERCDILLERNIGDTIEVTFQVKGTRIERGGKVYYNSYNECLKIEKL